MRGSSLPSLEVSNSTPESSGAFNCEDQVVLWRLLPIDLRYEVSDSGMVRNARTRHVLKPWLAGAGYHYLILGSHGLKTSVHRLVAMTFHGLPVGDRNEVAHFDGNPLNNHASNLRWATRKENVEDQRRHGTLRPPVNKGSAHPRSKLTDLEIHEIRRASVQTESLAKIAARYQVSGSTIGRIKKGKSWMHLPI